MTKRGRPDYARLPTEAPHPRAAHLEGHTIEEIVALHKGRHDIKFGGLYQIYKSGRINVTVPEFQFANVADLLANIPSHNGKIGLWGISYPGFYASAGMIDAHPALKAVSPQAPIADWFFDDFRHHATQSFDTE